VTITGTPLIGQTLTVDISQLGGSGALSYQWQRVAGGLGWVSVTYTNIADATAKTYTLVDEDVDTYFRVTVTRAGYAGSVTSAAVGAVPERAR